MCTTELRRSSSPIAADSSPTADDDTAGARVLQHRGEWSGGDYLGNRAEGKPAALECVGDAGKGFGVQGLGADVEQDDVAVAAVARGTHGVDHPAANLGCGQALPAQ